MRILVVLPRIPVPARDGGAIVMLETVRALHARGHCVDVCAVNTTKHHADPAVMESFCSSITAVDVDTSIRPIRFLRELISSSFPSSFGIASTSSYWLTRFASGAVLARLVDLIQSRPAYDVILCESLFTACYAEALRQCGVIGRDVRVVVHAHNVEGRIQERLAHDRTRSLPERLIRRRLAQQTLAYEHHVLTWCDAILPLSDVDRDYFVAQVPSVRAITVAPGVEEHPTTVQSEPNTLWFLGSLDWTPNLDGLHWFMQSVWPRIRATAPEVVVHIAGRATPPEIAAYHDGTHVIVHGEVEDASTFRAQYDVGIVPLLSGSGVRIKIIEALMDHSAVVTTSVGCEGLPIRNNEHACIADEPAAFADACVELLRNHATRDAMRRAGASVMREHYSWGKSAEQLDSVLQAICQGESHASFNA